MSERWLLGVIAALLAVIALELAPARMWMAMEDAGDSIKAAVVGRKEEMPAPSSAQSATPRRPMDSFYEQQALDAAAARVDARAAALAASK